MLKLKLTPGQKMEMQYHALKRMEDDAGKPPLGAPFDERSAPLTEKNFLHPVLHRLLFLLAHFIVVAAVIALACWLSGFF